MVAKSVISLAASALLLGVAGCGSSDQEASTAEPTTSATSEETKNSPPSEETPDAEPVVITIKDFEYAGPDSVAPGATVTVQNDDSSTHSVTPEDADAFVEVIIEGDGATGTFTAPSEPGEYSYVCKFHPEMVGTLVVE